MRTVILVALLALSLFLVSCTINDSTGNSVSVMEDAEFDGRMDTCLNKFGLDRSYCMHRLAYDSGNVALCERAGTFKNHCYVFAADKFEDPQICDLAGQMKEICLHQFPEE